MSMFIKSSLKSVVFLLLFSQQLHAQNEKLKTYQGNKYSIQYPEKWQMTNEKGIINFFPEENYGAVTISVHSGINFSLAKTKSFVIEMNDSKESPNNVKMTKQGSVTVFDYEYEAKGIKWVTRVFRKNNDLFLLTINCDDIYWDANKDAFLKVLHSFKLNTSVKG